MRRVLIGDFGAIVRLGLREILDEEGMTLVAEESPSQELMCRFLESRPDVVVVDLDDAGIRSAREITESYPAVKVIACSSNQPTLRVYPPFHRGESYELTLSPESFAHAVKDPT
ncbi:MAG: hypothetical protein GY722_01270 [bacterium]|nr:hypothetical protein [bacterium]